MNQLTVSLWGDEAFASILAQKSLSDIITIAARDTSPPLHTSFLSVYPDSAAHSLRYNKSPMAKSNQSPATYEGTIAIVVCPIASCNNISLRPMAACTL